MRREPGNPSPVWRIEETTIPVIHWGFSLLTIGLEDFIGPHGKCSPPGPLPPLRFPTHFQPLKSEDMAESNAFFLTEVETEARETVPVQVTGQKFLWPFSECWMISSLPPSLSLFSFF